MKLHFSIEPVTFQTLNSLPGAWGSTDYTGLLALMGFEETGDQAGSELQELCYMALADLEQEEAALTVLTYLLGSGLSKGQLGNLSQEILEEKLWEDFADLSLHETLFNAHQLLYDACKGGFPRPEALRFELRVHAGQSRYLQFLSDQTESGLIRLLVQGMPPNTKIARLYEQEIANGPFEDARHILWQLKRLEETAQFIAFDGISSPYWFSDLKQAGDFNAEIQWDPPVAT